jgi:hypothetical protein
LTESTDDSDAGDVACAGLPLFDAEKYRNELQDLDLTEQETIEFLKVIDFIMRSFVEVGWGVDSVIPALLQRTFASASDEVEEKGSDKSKQFSSAARDWAAERMEDDG